MTTPTTETATAAGEPVAWRWRYDDESPWCYGPTEPGNKGSLRSMMEPVEVQPLYLAPRPDPAAGELAGAIERINAALGKAEDIGTERVLFGRSGPGLILSDLRTLLAALTNTGDA